MKIRITRQVLMYLISESSKLLKAGWGEKDNDGVYGPGIIDELPSDTEAHRFMDFALAFIRYTSSILKYALADADDDLLPALSDLDIAPSGDSEV